MMKEIQFTNEQTESIRAFFNKRDYDFLIFPKLTLNRNGYFLTIDGTVENIEKLISLMKDNGIITE